MPSPARRTVAHPGRLLLLAACLLAAAVLPAGARDPDPIRGGILYDKYWTVVGLPAPTGNHPLYPAAGRQVGDVTYRCKECHGWDYKGTAGAYGRGSHFTGIRGVLSSTKTVDEMFALIKNMPDVTPNGHGFGALGLDDDDVGDLVAFLRTRLIDTDLYIDGDKRIRGDAALGRTGYLTTAQCHICHGKDGLTLNFGSDDEPEFVGTIAVDNPWELLHKIRVGQPGSNPEMPSWIAQGGTNQGAADIGRYIQDNLPTGLEPPAPTREADPIRGGLLYDKYWTVIGAPTPMGNHPLYPATARQSGDVTFRCKECHGWDYKGAAGAYGRGSHFSGIRGVFGSTKTAGETFYLIKNSPDVTLAGHGFGALGLGDDDVHDLVAFLKTLVLDTDVFIDGNNRFRGNAALGQMSYANAGQCRTCHGDDGTALNFGTGEEPEFLGTIAEDNPWELLHKIRVGQPGSVPEMPSWLVQGGSDQGAADIGRYIQDADFPTGSEPGPGPGPGPGPEPQPEVGSLVMRKGTAKQNKRGTWTVKGRASYDPGFEAPYAGDLSDLRMTVDGVAYFTGARPRAKRVRRTGAIVKFSVTGANASRLAVDLKRKRLVFVLRRLAAESFLPSDGVSFTIDLGDRRASVTAPITTRSPSRLIIEATAGTVRPITP